MPDISKCENKKCVKRLDCYRATAVNSVRQSYTKFKPENNRLTTFLCAWFIPKKL